MNYTPNALPKQKIWSIADEASRLIKGHKCKINLVCILHIFIFIFLYFLSCFLILAHDPVAHHAVITHQPNLAKLVIYPVLLSMGVSLILVYPFQIVIWILSLRLAIKDANKISAFKVMIKSLHRFIPIIFGIVSIFLLIAWVDIQLSYMGSSMTPLIGLIFKFATFPFIFVYAFAVLLAVNQKTSGVEALKQGFIGVFKNYRLCLKMASICLLLGTLGIITIVGWIWFFPQLFVMVAILFRKIYGLETVESTNNNAPQLEVNEIQPTTPV